MNNEYSGDCNRLISNIKEYGVYIHWPFCKSKCPYCDFNSHVAGHIDIERWRQAYIIELDYYRQLLGDVNIKTIFFGGGTPSLMPPSLLSDIIAHVHNIFAVDDNVEITMEANPNSVEIDKFNDFKAAGINRVSVGIQSIYDDQLQFLGRTHDSKQAIAAIKTAAAVFDNYSFDLIYARPGQTVENWRKELTIALDYVRDHFSLYQLTIEPGTLFHTYWQRGDLILPDNDTCATMYELTAQMLSEKGIAQYEVSNYARPGVECRHNLIYWQYENYIGIGPGAHGRIQVQDDKDRGDQGNNGQAWIHQSTQCHRAPEKWLELCATQGHGINRRQNLNTKEIIYETVLMGLRLSQGLNVAQLMIVYKDDLWLIINRDKMNYLLEKKVLIMDGDYLRIAHKELIRSNGVIEYILV